MNKKLKKVFIYNETYPLPEEAYQHYSAKVAGCSNNPMCLNNVKSDVENFISKYGRQAGVKIESGDESGFVILQDNQDFMDKLPDAKKINIKTIAVIVIIIAAAIAIIKKQMVFAIIAILVFTVVFGAKYFQSGKNTPQTVDNAKKEASEPEPAQSPA